MRFIAVGDPHFTDSRGLGGLSAYIKNPDEFVANEIRKACDYATKKGVKWVFLLGDICQSPVMSVEAHRQLLSLISDYPDLRFVGILGNHDLKGEVDELGHSMQLMCDINKAFKGSNLYMFTKPAYKTIEDERFYFLPWPHSKFDDEAINIAHVEVDGATTDNGRLHEGGDDSDAQAIVGHLHTKHSVRSTHYAGTLYQTGFGETEEKYFLDCTVIKNTLEVEAIRTWPKYVLRTLRWGVDIDATNIESVAVPTIEKTNQTVLYRIQYRTGDVLPSNLPNHIVKTQRIKTDYNEPDPVFQLEQTALTRDIDLDSMFVAFFKESGYTQKQTSSLMNLREAILSGDIK